MYYQNYEDYMRQVLGYPINDPNIYETYDYRNDQMLQDTYSVRNQTMSNMSDEEIRKCYPEIYHLINPMVCKVCETNTQPITQELIERMTDEVYMAIEDTSTTVNIRVNAPKIEENRISNSNTSKSDKEEIRTSRARREVSTSRTMNERTNKSDLEKRETKPIATSTTENREATESVETRQSNSALRDLIKILILNQIFGNRPRPPRPPRPPFPGGPGPGMPPPRPPFPGGRPPMGPGNRPPMIQPREHPDFL